METLRNARTAWNTWWADRLHQELVVSITVAVCYVGVWRWPGVLAFFIPFMAIFAILYVLAVLVTMWLRHRDIPLPKFLMSGAELRVAKAAEQERIAETMDAP